MQGAQVEITTLTEHDGQSFGMQPGLRISHLKESLYTNMEHRRQAGLVIRQLNSRRSHVWNGVPELSQQSSEFYTTEE